MRKFNPIIFICFVITSVLMGCGMPGSLYETPEKQVNDNTKQAQPSKNQQEN